MKPGAENSFALLVYALRLNLHCTRDNKTVDIPFCFTTRSKGPQKSISFIAPFGFWFSNLVCCWFANVIFSNMKLGSEEPRVKLQNFGPPTTILDPSRGTGRGVADRASLRTHAERVKR